MMPQAKTPGPGQGQVSAWNLAERTRGCCPACGVYWAASPGNHCPCTEPRPGDEAKLAAALAKAQRQRRNALAQWRGQVAS